MYPHPEELRASRMHTQKTQNVMEGLDPTVERLRHLWWPKMSDDTRKFVETCHVCQARKTERSEPRAQMHYFVTFKPLQLITMDALGVQASVSEKKYIFVAIDCFTRFVDAEPSDNFLAESFARFLKEFVGRLGVASEILSDNAPTMCNEHVRKITA